ncbi:4Fe-4S dicluster domain-containing protein [Selenomonas caprae]|jgi:adenylylsulfate reductase subunit B|uniref:Adenylylsulfate reductase subunit B n=2 Tax=Selenomonas TaxID=970 RepID=A0A1I3FHW0_SELRU|nr:MULTISPECIES: ferredoxin family protein [Selenomonas]MDD6134610.1 ferredoxin family protein [Selenomonadaceae bacterium]TYZ27469.1 4Fe-4S dicluster domain-containing protein [Selenomonas caprae]SFI10800.1 adenylylsulfate reductase subunit B [Selenomonas ruminantium]SFT76292.1 adenylylsulfate reductase subunit B [Selenomonas ruminantium]
MSISIEPEKCVGCGRCTEVCPGNLLEVTAGKAAIREVRDCWGCTACVKECPRDAIFYYLSADLGGAGGRLYAHDSAASLTWQLRLPDGSEQEIIVAKNKANAY